MQLLPSAQLPGPLRHLSLIHILDEYFLDLRSFFRFLKLDKGRVAKDTPFDEISIDDVDLDLVRGVTLSDVYALSLIHI